MTRGTENGYRMPTEEEHKMICKYLMPILRRKKGSFSTVRIVFCIIGAALTLMPIKKYEETGSLFITAVFLGLAVIWWLLYRTSFHSFHVQSEQCRLLQKKEYVVKEVYVSDYQGSTTLVEGDLATVYDNQGKEYGTQILILYEMEKVIKNCGDRALLLELPDGVLRMLFARTDD